jgi:DNA-directed RNA polymerase delta subunit
MSSKQPKKSLYQTQEEIKNLKTSLVVGQLLSVLPPRVEKILELRFGLAESKPMVLGEIGKKMGITRERVRQIEVNGFNKLRKTPKSTEFLHIIEQAREVLQKGGGFCEKTFLKERLIANPSQIQRNQLMFILNCSTQLKFYRENIKLKGFWLDKKAIFNKDEIVAFHDAILRLLEKEKRPMNFEEIWTVAKKLILAKSKDNIFISQKGRTMLRRLLLLSRKIKRNILEEWGIKNWREISEKGSREKAYLVLRKAQKPLHFREITNQINRHWKEKRTLPQTVHNELIKDQRFVLVGRGIYGLKEWGLEEGTVKDIIIQFLKENKGKQEPIHRDKIVAYVLSKKRVKRTTVLVNLANKDHFLADHGNAFRLKRE